ncbi:MAG: hypothetical protein QME96_16810, partial [Myxococcota bacterium]|nr:hypothetical protein [Myxococcota bacterium]
MKRNKKWSRKLAVGAVGAAVALAAGTAWAQAPDRMPVQGTLTDATGVRVTGDRTMTFRIFTVPAGVVPPIWVETQVVPVVRGTFTVYLNDVAGTANFLRYFRDNTNLYLEVQVAPDGPMPRFQLATTPYGGLAQYAGDADTLDTLDSAAFQRRVGATCAAGSSIRVVNADGTVVCETDDGATYTAGAGLNLVGTQFSADQATIQTWARDVCYDTEAELTTALDDNYFPAMSCPVGQIPKSTGAFLWACAVDAGGVSQVNTGAGLTGGPITTIGTISVANGGITSAMIANGTILFEDWSTPCVANQIPKFDGTNWSCAADAAGTGTVTGISAGTPGAITGGGLTFSANPITTTGSISIATGGVTSALIADNTILFADWASNGCAANFIPKWNGAAWACAADGGITAEVDGVIGNEILNATNATLVRSGAGTAADPFT